MRCPRCGGTGPGLTTTEMSSTDPAARWITICAGCDYHWVHPYPTGWGST